MTNEALYYILGTREEDTLPSELRAGLPETHAQWSGFYGEFLFHYYLHNHPILLPTHYNLRAPLPSSTVRILSKLLQR